MDTIDGLKTDVFNNDAKYTSCPYNSSHRILRARLQYHLVKCRRNMKTNAEEEKLVCPLDATHHVNKDAMEEHLKTCPSRRIIDSETYLMGSEVSDPPSSYKFPEVPPCEENWDDPPEGPSTYDPTAHLENQPIIRTVLGVSKSERKAFRLVERMKMVQFHSGQPMDASKAAAAVGVTIDNGKCKGRGRGRGHNQSISGQVSKGPGMMKEMEKLAEAKENDTPQFPPTEARPLRPVLQESVAQRLIRCGITGDDDNVTLENDASRKVTGILQCKKPVPVGSVGPKSTANVTVNDKKTLPSGGWSNSKASPIVHKSESNKDETAEEKGGRVSLEEYKERVKESKLVAKMGFSDNESSGGDPAHYFTNLDEEWQVQGRRGRVMRGQPRGNMAPGAKPKGRNC